MGELLVPLDAPDLRETEETLVTLDPQEPLVMLVLPVSEETPELLD